MRVYFLPGLFGSTLDGINAFGRRSEYWLSPAVMLLLKQTAMQLDAEGLNPGPDGIPLFPGVPYEDVYGDALKILARQLEDVSGRIVPWPYDWRKDCTRSASLLAADIAERVPNDNPCVLVGHSQGGLVARLAWHQLSAAGQAQKIKRVITLGTSHWGSYAATMIFAAAYDEFKYFQTLQSILNGLAWTPGVPPIVPKRITVDQLIAMCATWPALYQLFPNLHAPDASTDPLRKAIFDVSNYLPARAISPRWMLEALQLHETLADPSSQPPTGRMTCIAGIGRPCVNGLAAISALEDGTPWLSTDDSDGVVPKTSAILPRCYSYLVPCDHRYLPANAVASGLIAAEIEADRPDELPTPAPGLFRAVVGAWRDMPVIPMGGPADPQREFCPKGTRVR